MKKDIIVKIFLVSAIVAGVVAAILNKAKSWSQLDQTDYNPLLNFILGCIFATYLLSFAFHPLKEKEITVIKFFKWRIPFILKWVFFVNAFFYLMVLTFGVNHSSELFQALHIGFTGAAILTGFLPMLTLPETKKGHLIANTGIVLGVVGFLLGFAFNLYSTSWSESIVAVILGIFLLVTFKVKNKILYLVRNFNKNKK